MPGLSGQSGVVFVMLAASGLAGCGAHPVPVLDTAAIVANAETDRDLPRRPWAPEPHAVPGSPPPAPHAGALSLSEAVDRVVAYNPAIKAAFFEIEAKHGETAQAAVKPNPELSFEVENVGKDVDPEETLQLSQLVELGDKRVKRLRAAHLEAAVAGWDMETVRVEAISQAAEAFVDVLSAQERINVLGDFVTVSEKTRASVGARVSAGKSSPIENDRAAVAVARAKAALKSEQARLAASKRKLSALWGSGEADFERAQGRLASERRIPSMAQIQAHFDANPDLARWSDEIGRRHAQLAVEQSKSIPDLRLAAGVRRFEETDSSAFLASVSMPLQVFDRNVGNIVAAERRIDKAALDQEAARGKLTRTVVDAYGALTIAEAQLKALEKDVLPAAENAFAKTKIGYDEGKFDLLNVLDTQRAVFEARLDLVNAKADFEKAKVQVETLIGRRLGDV